MSTVAFDHHPMGASTKVVDKDYSGTPLPKKLGIREGSAVAFVGVPRGFRRTLGPLPAGVRVRPQARGPLDVVVLFTTAAADLHRRLGGLARGMTPAGELWVVWPKKASGVATDLSFDEVQRTGLQAGLVDNKSCSIDDTWQALRFVIRKENRPGHG